MYCMYHLPFYFAAYYSKLTGLKVSQVVKVTKEVMESQLMILSTLMKGQDAEEARRQKR